MRVTFLTTQLNMVNGGGSNPDRDARARAMKELGCDVKFVTVFSQNNRFAEPFPAPVFEERLNPKEMHFFSFHRAVAALMKKYEPETDVFFVDGHVFLLGAGFYRKAGGKPTVGYFEAYSFPTGTLRAPSLWKGFKYLAFKWLDKLVVSRWGNTLDAFLAVSPTTRDIFIGRGLKKEKWHLLPNAMDFSIFQQEGEEFRCPNPEKFHVLYSARITDDKGVDVLLHAMKQLPEVDITADIVGEGPAKEGYVKLAGELHLEGKVFWHERVPRTMLASVFRHAGVFVYPTRRAEALGTASLDSLACGTPVIVSSDTGMVWGVGEGGLVFKNGDPKDLAAKIRMVYENPELRRSMAEKGGKRAQEFDYRKVSRDLLDILTRVAAPRTAER